MKLITHNGKFVYEVDNLRNVITLKYRNIILETESDSSFLVSTARNIVSIFSTCNDCYLLAVSDAEGVVCTYSINQITGQLIAMSPFKTAIQGLPDLLAKLNEIKGREQ